MPAATVDDLRRADRVLCYGVTGSGTSTAAVLLGERLRLPVHLVDEEIGWLPGWVQRPVAEQRELATELVTGERWVLDSVYGSFRDLVLPRVDVVVGLDYPRWLSLGRLVRRTCRRWWTQTSTCNGSVETLSTIVSRDSIIVWHVRSYTRKTRRVRQWESQPDGIPVLRLSHPRDLDRVLAELS